MIINTLFEKSGLQLKLTLSRQGDQVRITCCALTTTLRCLGRRRTWLLQYMSMSSRRSAHAPPSIVPMLANFLYLPSLSRSFIFALIPRTAPTSVGSHRWSFDRLNPTGPTRRGASTSVPFSTKTIVHPQHPPQPTICRLWKVLCRIRAPIVLLERQAARDGYRLQFRGEVRMSCHERFENFRAPSSNFSGARPTVLGHGKSRCRRHAAGGRAEQEEARTDDAT